jgi:N-acetylglucosaminyldiphosphoundecaprenol N-acetyl-beta-D-mannosaminyltransferase
MTVTDVAVDVERRHETFDVLGVSVGAVQVPDVVRRFRAWIAARDRCRYIAVTGMHGIVQAQTDRRFKHVLDEAELVVPDGMPLVWLGRSAGHHLPRRVYGPELMETFLRDTRGRYRHFFYGGGSGVPERLASMLYTRHGVHVVGTLSPPFRPLTPEEDEDVIRRINRSGADVLWVGLSTPKQEYWMHEHASRLEVPVTVGVGAAFDFLSGTKRSAPAWMQERGLEWLFRLVNEPTRLWRRYLVGGSLFVYWIAVDRIRQRRPSRCASPTQARTGIPRSAVRR